MLQISGTVTVASFVLLSLRTSVNSMANEWKHMRLSDLQWFDKCLRRVWVRSNAATRRHAVAAQLSAGFRGDEDCLITRVKSNPQLQYLEFEWIDFENLN